MSKMKLTANVYLHNEFIATLESNGVTCEFKLSEHYKANTRRNTLSLQSLNLTTDRLELLEYPNAPLPPFIQSILPEGVLREYLIVQSGMTIDENSFGADAYLLKAVGLDLPGALEIRDVITESIKDEFNNEISEPSPNHKHYFSLPGVQQKFSFIRRGNHFHIPLNGEYGNFIIKPQPVNSKLISIVHNEYFHMRLASLCGLNIPEIGILSLNDEEISTATQLEKGTLCFYIERFDRDGDLKVHMEELHQALRIEGKITSDSKYVDFNFVEVIGFLHRVDQKYQSDLLEGYLKELAFNVLIGNADFHLKNSAIHYPNRTKPQKAPSYDILNTEFYGYYDMPLDLGLDGYSNMIADFDSNTFSALLQKAGVPDNYDVIFNDMKQAVKSNYQTAMQDDIFNQFLDTAFKQRLKDRFEQFFFEEPDIPGPRR